MRIFLAGPGSWIPLCILSAVALAGAPVLAQDKDSAQNGPVWKFPVDGSKWDGPGFRYPVQSQRNLTGFSIVPQVHAANDDSVLFLKGIDVDYSDVWGDFDYLYGIQAKVDNSRFAVSHHKGLKSDIAWYNFSAQNTIDGYAKDGVGPFPRIIGYWANFCDAGHTGNGADWTADLMAGFELRDHEPNGCIWGGTATINNFYGILIEDQPAAGAHAKKWWAGAFGGPVLIQKDASLFWGKDLRTGETEGSAGLKWNSRTRQLETSVKGVPKTRLSSTLWTASGVGIVQSTCKAAPAATVLAADGCNVIGLSGGGAVSSIRTCDSANAGRQLIVLCGTSSARVSDGGNLALAGDFACTADDSLTLLCDGAKWVEITRSLN
jgi:hypothetical protein